MNIPTTMQAAVIDRFGGVDQIQVRHVPVPQIDDNQVLLRVQCAGVAKWDPLEREGGFAQMLGITPTFPYIMGTDAAGTVVAVGAKVTRVKVGDLACCAMLCNPKGGFYAQYAAVDQDAVCRTPSQLSTEQAGVMLSDALTALDGLEKVLKIKPGETIMIFGAGGGLGHLAVQLARRLGARVLAVASGEDGVELCHRIGADAVTNGRRDDVVTAARALAPDGLDVALMTAGGDAADRALTAMRPGGRVAHPDGVMPIPNVPAGVSLTNYSVEVTVASIDRLLHLIGSGAFHVNVARLFPLEHAADAHRFLGEHFPGKIGLRVE